MATNDDAIAQLRKSLELAQQHLGNATQQLVALETARASRIADARSADVTGSLQAVRSLGQKEATALGEAREKGQGPGLYKALDEASALEHERAELVHEAMDPSRRDQLDGVLARLLELETQQRQLLVDELGKFEAQGMRGMLDTLTALGQQQREVVERLVERRRGNG